MLLRDFADAREQEAGALMRAVWRAGRWLDEEGHHGTAAEIISRPAYLDLPPELVERGLTGRMTVSARGEIRETPGFVSFNEGAASFPWKSLAALLRNAWPWRMALTRRTRGSGPWGISAPIFTAGTCVLRGAPARCLATD
ncbi:hypothetical protein ACFSYD_22160 [Paracoccus aerius]